MQYDAVLFDNDGVLTTPTSWKTIEQAIRIAFERVGISSPAESHVQTLRRPTVESLTAVANANDVDAKTLWHERERAAIDAQIAEIRAGRKRLYDDVRTLDGLERPRGIVSNNQHETIETIVDHFALDGFDPWYGREPTLEGIDRKKPTPHYLERAIEDLAADNPLYVGDSRVDVAAADVLGIDSAFLRREHRNGYELDREPTYQIDTLGVLVELV